MRAWRVGAVLLVVALALAVSAARLDLDDDDDSDVLDELLAIDEEAEWGGLDAGAGDGGGAERRLCAESAVTSDIARGSLGTYSPGEGGRVRVSIGLGVMREGGGGGWAKRRGRRPCLSSRAFVVACELGQELKY